jgi:hypothetical protein
MREALWIHANLEGRARWYIAIDRGDSIYFPEIDFEEDMNLETYQTEFPHFKVRAIPTVEEWDNLCAAYEKMISPLLTRREPFNSQEAVNTEINNDGTLRDD